MLVGFDGLVVLLLQMQYVAGQEMRSRLACILCGALLQNCFCCEQLLLTN